MLCSLPSARATWRGWRRACFAPFDHVSATLPDEGYPTTDIVAGVRKALRLYAVWDRLDDRTAAVISCPNVAPLRERQRRHGT